MATELDTYKKRFDLKNDGETVLMSADMGYFSEGGKTGQYMNIGNMKIPKNTTRKDLLERMGIKPEMNRDEIIKCLKGRMKNGDLNNLALEHTGSIRHHIFDMLRRPNTESDTDVYYDEEDIKESAFERIKKTAEAVIQFCEDDTRK